MRHPLRDLSHSSRCAEIQKDKASVNNPGEGICIAYGENPRVKATKGNYIGLIKFAPTGEIVGGLWEVGKVKPENPQDIVKEHTWYTVNDDGNLTEVEDERKND